jgi:predicted nuclease with TOPRIM domain
MEYKDLKKEELVKLLEEQVHLAKAVEAKDAEINKLVEKIKKLEVDLAKVPDIKKFEDVITKLQDDNKRLVAFANQHINIFKNTLKALQGTLDNAIELEDIVVNGVKEK